MIDLLL